jgi:hypothetical protein
MDDMDPSSLTHEFKLLVLLDHFEKSSILRALVQAAETELAKLPARAIKVEVRMVERISERLW